MGKDGRDAVRVTTTLTREQHAELERLAQQHGVKVAWLLRRATERLIEQASDGSSFPLNFGQKTTMRSIELFSGCGGLALACPEPVSTTN